MSSIDVVKCPNCGTTKSYHLGGYGFAFEKTTKCQTCSTTFDNVENTIESIDPDREIHERAKVIGQNPPPHVLRAYTEGQKSATQGMRRYAIQRKVPTDGNEYRWETVLNFDAQPCAHENLAAWLNTGMKVDWRVVECP